MKITKQNIHLFISIVIVIPAALIYGFNPDQFLEINPETYDELNFFKAIMMVYLGFSFIWILGLFRPNYLKIALVSNCVFMLCLPSGRILSIILDGIPSFPYVYGIIGELILGIYGLWIIIRNPLK